MKAKTYIIIALLTFLSGCTKDDSPKLPPETQIGANTFGCKINGVIYECSGYLNIHSVISFGGVYASIYDDSVLIKAVTSNPYNKIYLRFNIDNKYKTGIYKKGIRIAGIPFDNFDSKITVTRFDKSVISGIFQMRVKSRIKYYHTDGVHFTYKDSISNITEGRFDIELKE